MRKIGVNGQKMKEQYGTEKYSVTSHALEGKKHSLLNYMEQRIGLPRDRTNGIVSDFAASSILWRMLDRALDTSIGQTTELP